MQLTFLLLLHIFCYCFKYCVSSSYCSTFLYPCFSFSPTPILVPLPTTAATSPHTYHSHYNFCNYYFYYHYSSSIKYYRFFSHILSSTIPHPTTFPPVVPSISFLLTPISVSSSPYYSYFFFSFTSMTKTITFTNIPLHTTLQQLLLKLLHFLRGIILLYLFYWYSWGIKKGFIFIGGWG